ncbi:MAG: tetratricopeptide repeat protein, partial [Candidatus Brocadiia bacterium]
MQQGLKQNLLDINPPSPVDFSSQSPDPVHALNSANSAIQDRNFELANQMLNDKTLEAAQKYLLQNPQRIDLIVSIATALCKINGFDSAEKLCLDTLNNTQNAAIYNKLATILLYKGRLTEAFIHQAKAFSLEPEKPELAANMARLLIETGHTNKGITLLRNAVDNMPNNSQAHSNLLFRLHQQQELDYRFIFEEHLRWAMRHVPAERARTNHANNPDPSKKLRVGYISPDFRLNSVAYFFESLLDGHNRNEVELFGYGNIEFHDQFTERLMQKFDIYQNVYHLSDRQLADLIDENKIDILVDLAGHTGNNRLTAMAYKPAPIQVTYLGYPNTTGIRAIDYRFTDSDCEMPNSQQFYTEQLINLPDGFLCYRPPDHAQGVSAPPCKENGFITFGSFNNNCKINPALVKLWADVLNEIPRSKMLLKIKGGQFPEIQAPYFTMFETAGINPERINIIGWVPPEEHHQTYSLVDIALDTYPYNGTTTTCEALWMGVPVITLVGGHHISRVGLSILKRI